MIWNDTMNIMKHGVRIVAFVATYTAIGEQLVCERVPKNT